MTRDEIVAFGRGYYHKKIGRGGTLREGEPIPDPPSLTEFDHDILASRLGRELTQDDRDAFAQGFGDPFGGPMRR